MMHDAKSGIIDNNSIIPLKVKKIITWVSLSPLIITIGLLFLLNGHPIDIIKDVWKTRYQLNITPEDFPRLSEVIYYLICTYTVIVSGIFSYLLYKATEKSLIITRKLAEIEVNKEEWELKKNAKIIYFDLIRGIDEIKKIYISNLSGIEQASIHRLNLSLNWIDSILILSDKLDTPEIKNLYYLYDNFLLINSYNERLNASNFDIVYSEQVYDRVMSRADKNSSYYQYNEELHKVAKEISKSVFSDTTTKVIYDNYDKVELLRNEIRELDKESSEIYNRDRGNLNKGTSAYQKEYENKRDMIKDKEQEKDDMIEKIKCYGMNLLNEDIITDKYLKPEYYTLLKKIRDVF